MNILYYLFEISRKLIAHFLKLCHKSQSLNAENININEIKQIPFFFKQ